MLKVLGKVQSIQLTLIITIIEVEKMNSEFSDKFSEIQKSKHFKTQIQKFTNFLPLLLTFTTTKQFLLSFFITFDLIELLFIKEKFQKFQKQDENFLCFFFKGKIYI